ncbi:MAG: response regulator [Polyangiales bacterium]|nr:response regulator [Myxococcales bacterium]
MAADRYKYFRLEAQELLEQLSQGVLELERTGASPARVQHLLRVAHTLKGAARVVKQREMADSAHAFEGVLQPHRETEGALPTAGIQSLLELVDDMTGRLRALDAPEAGAPTQAAAKPTQSSTQEEMFRTVRADVEEMTALLDGILEARTQLGTLQKAADHVRTAQDVLGRLTDHLVRRAAGERSRSRLGGRADKAIALVEELQQLLDGYDRQTQMPMEQLDRELATASEAADQLRLIPARATFANLERTVRDAAHANGKQATFHAAGGDIRLDGHVLGTVQSALVQMVRNAVAHGLESPEERRQSGKPEAGSVRVEVLRRGRRVVFRCTDDGRGLDLAAIRSAAEVRGIRPQETGALDAAGLTQLLLRGGLSTAKTVTGISGRGIGLDVVRDTAERLGGQVHVRSSAGQGTTFELVAPASLASLTGLVVESEGELATIPLDSVRYAFRLRASDISRTAHGESIVYEDKVIPFLPLPRALRQTREGGHAGNACSAVVLEGARGLAAVGADRMLGTANIVVRPLPALTLADPIVSGASIDGNGNPRIVLDPDALVTMAFESIPVVSTGPPARIPVLVIDDSLTTRMLEQSILESAGYEVTTASSAEEGLEKARAARFSLILVDVEMPGMDGFSFVETVRADAALRHIPTILVTSRSEPEDLERGRRVGANGYIIKSEFDQADLLQRIRNLIS